MNLPGRESMERSKKRGQGKSHMGRPPSAKFAPGARFGMLVITRNLRGGKVECRCDCGEMTEKWCGNIEKNFTVSCGCARGTQRPVERPCLLAEVWR